MPAAQAPRCDLHPPMAAVYRCDTCRMFLCRLCTKKDGDGVLCSACGKPCRAPTAAEMSGEVSRQTQVYRRATSQFERPKKTGLVPPPPPPPPLPPPAVAPAAAPAHASSGPPIPPTVEEVLYLVKKRYGGKYRIFVKDSVVKLRQGLNRGVNIFIRSDGVEAQPRSVLDEHSKRIVFASGMIMGLLFIFPFILAPFLMVFGARERVADNSPAEVSAADESGADGEVAEGVTDDSRPQEHSVKDTRPTRVVVRTPTIRYSRGRWRGGLGPVGVIIGGYLLGAFIGGCIAAVVVTLMSPKSTLDANRLLSREMTDWLKKETE